ncbi:DUF2244 domain-containing protein [Bordetella sp. H567]|uniref:DUF2244 domain-containing protein n=1 Tax=Bordetella sp. H567 TaxID=1697043 RepID=UPI0013143A6F|nr:DUF2244 domain-containing protein [Bordetella sp. H567]
MRHASLNTDDLVSAAPPTAGVWAPAWRPPPGRHVWRLKRNCALRPTQYAAAMGLLMGISAVVAIACWIGGIWLVPIFCCIELSAVAVAALAYARHAIDGETITLTETRDVRVEIDRGLRHETYLLQAQGLRLVKEDADTLWLRQGAIRIQVGGHAAPAMRDAFEAELRDMLAGRPGREPWADTARAGRT